MSELDPTAYFKRKLDSLNMPKQASITEAMQIKLQGLQEYQQAVAQNRAFLNPDRSLADIAGDIGITALSGVIAVPEAAVGVASLMSGGAAGKYLEELGLRPGDARKFLKEQLSDAQKEANLRVDLADGFWGTAQAAIENPSTILTTAGESAPLMLGGAGVARGLLNVGAKAVGLAAGGMGPALPGVLARVVGAEAAPVVAAAIGEGVVGAGSAAEQIRQQTEDGRLTLKQSLAAAGSGAATAALGLVGGKVAQRLGLADLDTMLAAGGNAKTPVKFAKALVGSGISEGVFEELPQSTQEQMWQNFALDKPLMEGVDKAAAMGMLTGMAMGQTAGTVAALGSIGSGAGESTGSADAPSQDQKAAQEAAIASGDVSALLDPKNAATGLYDPAQAVAALAGHSALKTTTPEVRQANLEKAGQIVEDLEKQHRRLTALLQSNSPEGIAENKALLAEAQAAGDTDTVELLQSVIEKAEAMPAENLRGLQAQLGRTGEYLNQARENLGRFTVEAANTDTQVKPEQIPDLVKSLDTPVDVNDTAALATRSKQADAVINLSMAAPEHLDPQVAKQLAANTSNGLNAAQRTYLRQFSEARVAENELKDMDLVQEEVMVGGKGYIGLAQHRARIAPAIAAGNQKLVNQYLNTLRKFQADHLSKATVAALAMKEGLGTQIEKTEAGWQIATEHRTDAQLRANGGLTLNSPKLVAAIQAEAKAITTTLGELEAAQALRFQTKTTKEEKADVQDLPQAHAPSANPAGGAKAVQAAQPAQQGAAAGAGDVGAPAARPGARAAALADAGVARESQKTEESPVKAQTEKTEPQSTESSQSIQSTEATASRAEGQTQSTDSISEETSSTENTSSSESPEETSAQLDVSGAPEGQLSVLAQKEEGNPVAKGFTQTDGREDDKTRRPLVAVKDFAKQMVQRAEEFVGAPLDEKQKRAVETFQKVAQTWGGVVRKFLKEREKPEYRHEDIIQHLMVDGPDGQADLDENVKTAIAYAAFNWVASEATAPALRTKESVNAMLGKDENAHLPFKTYQRLASVGVFQHVLYDSLGGSVMDALGLKAKKDAPKNHEARLRMALGVHAANLLEQRGLVKRTTIMSDELAKLMEDAGDAPQKPLPVYFLALARDEKQRPVENARKIHEVLKGTGGVLDKLFKTEQGSKLPSLAPIEQVQRTTKGTDMPVPDELADVIKKNQASPRKARKDLLQLLGQFDETQVHSMMGVQDEESPHVHINNRLGVKAKNDGLRREWADFQEFLGEHLGTAEAGLDTPFYYAFSVWKQQRVGIATTVGNPQTSKIARHLVYSPDWEVEIQSTDEALMNSFFLRVAEGLGVKTERKDNELSIAEVKDLLAQPVYADAIQALRKSTLTADDQAAVVAAVKKGKSKLHTLDVLVAMAYQQEAEAKAKGQPYSFKSLTMGEVDGVANGTMLQSVLLGAGQSAADLQTMLNAGGFFEQGSDHTQYNQWRGTPGNLDLYERTARKLHRTMTDLVAGFSPEKRAATAAIWAIAGEIYNDEKQSVEKEGRDLIKGALNPLSFGSGLKAVLRGMAGTFLDTVYEGFEDLSKNEASQADIDAYVDHINTLLKSMDPKAKPLPAGLSITEYLNNSLSERSEKLLMQAFEKTVGEGVQSVIKTEFKTYLDRRDALNKTANAAYALFDAARQGEREAYVAELVAKGEIARNDKGELLADLTAGQEAELERRLRKIAPVVRTLMSGKKTSSGLRLASMERDRPKSNPYRNKTKFGQALGTGFKSITVDGYTAVEAEPGVRAGSAMTHSFDSGISHRVQTQMDVLNIHDALGAGVAGLGQAARLLNQNVWEGALAYSPLDEVHLALARVVEGLAEMQAKGELSKEAAARIKPLLADVPGQLLASKLEAVAANQMKLQLMANWTSVDQYAFEGGNYEVTDADRAKAKKLLEEQTPELSPWVVEALKTLGEEPKSDFGKEGAPATLDQGLVEFFKKNPEPSVRDVLAQLYRSIKAKGEGRTTAFQLELIKQLNKSIDPSVKVKLVTPGTKASQVLALPKQPSLGWFVAQDGKAEVYVLNQEFINSGLQSTETLLHEMVHAAVAQAVANPNEATAPLVQELEALMVEAKAHPKSAEFGEALGSVQEFIAWGMTSQRFQREVLEQITMRPTKGENALVTGFKAFVDTLVGILFKDSDKSAQARAVNGMTLMIQNVSGLLNQAEQSKALGTGSLNLSQAVQSFTTLDIQEALNGDGLTQEFGEKLKGLLGSLVLKLHGPFGAFRSDVLQKTSAAATPEAVWEKAKETGVAPLALSVEASPIKASEQELHAMQQVEATVRAALDNGDAFVRTAAQELNDLYVEMRAALKPSDFSHPDAYDFIFKVEIGADGRSHHLARFAAFSLAHQEFNTLMQRATAPAGKKVKEGKSFGEKVQIVFEKILNFFAEKVTHTFHGQRADAKLERLVEQLIDIEAKKRLTIARAAAGRAGSPVASVEKALEGIGEAARKTVTKVAGSNFIRNNRFATVQFAGAMARIKANDQVEYWLQTLQQFRDAHFSGLHNTLMQTLSQVQGPGQILNLLQLLSTNAQRQRKHIITQTSKAALQAFSQQFGKKDTEAKAAISQVFLRTGMHKLLGKHSLLDLEQMLGDRKALDQAINATEAELLADPALQPYVDQFIHQANALGYFRVTGKVRHPRLMMNAHNIANLYGTTHAGRLTAAEAQVAEGVIERLVALYALSYVDGQAKVTARALFQKENDRADGGNGVEFVLKMHQNLEREAADRNFRNQKALMLHGFTPEIYNPGTVVAVANDVEGKELLNQGYKKLGPVKLDPTDPDREARSLYVLKDGGLARFQTGIVSYSDKQAKGSKKHSGYLNVNTADGLDNASFNADVSAAKPAGLSRGPRPDLSQNGNSYLAPVVNPQGQIVNWRYLMEDATKDEVLERDSRFENLLGVMAGSIYDKESTAETNSKALDALREIYLAGRHKEAGAFVQVGPQSSEPKLREIWSMLPEETKAMARNMFGKDGLYVRKDMLLPVFGFRQYSLADAFKKDPSQRTAAEKFLVEAIERPLATWMRWNAKRKGIQVNLDEARRMAKKAAVLITRGEKIWQELVHEIKDIIVVKAVTTMVDNILSNWSQLLISGVPIKDIIRHHAVALRGARAYEENKEALDQLEILVSVGKAPANAQQEIARLKDALARNPVGELVEAGLMPTIVEDVAAEDESDPFTYKSQLARKVSKYTDKLNPTVLNVAKGIYMAHDTKLYQGLSRMTKISDFMARYTLYQHMMTEKNADGSRPKREDVLHEVSEAFVNYDSPLPKGLQYLDQMGIMPFTKYYLRMQRVLFRLLKKKPARVIGTMLVDNFVNLGPIVLDSSWFHKLGNNPLEWGALQLPGTVDELGTVAAATAVLK